VSVSMLIMIIKWDVEREPHMLFKMRRSRRLFE